MPLESHLQEAQSLLAAALISPLRNLSPLGQRMPLERVVHLVWYLGYGRMRPIIMANI